MTEVQAEGQENFPKWISWATWGCAAAFFFFQFVVRVSPSVFTDQLMSDLNISACDYGALISVYYMSYSSVQLFVGLILDRLGVRYPLILASLLICSGCLIFSYSSDLTMLKFARFIIGVGSALGFLSCIKTASMWFTSERIGLMIGLSVMIGMAGGTSGGYPMAYLVKYVGWRESMMVLAAIAAGLAFLTFLMARDRKQPVGHSLVDDVKDITIMESLKVLLSNPQTYLYGLFGALMYVPMSAFVDAWGIKFIMMLYGVENLEASASVSITYIGLAASGPLLAIVADRWRSFKKLMMLGSLISLVGYLIAIYVQLPSIYYTYPLFFITGFALGAQFFAFACIVELNPRQVSATASGLQNMANMYGSGFAVYLIGLILDYISDGKLDDVISRYTIEDFHVALSTVPISILVACGLLLFIKEAYPQPETVK